MASDMNVALSGIGGDLDIGSGRVGDFDWDLSVLAGSEFTSVNQTTPSTQTISPKDLFNDPLASAPASTAFTNLTTPDMPNESPYMLDSLDTSPAFFGDDLTTSHEHWPSLFPDAEQPAADNMQRTVSNQSLALSSPSSNSPLVLDSSTSRRKSSTSSPAILSASSFSGVKPRRRKAPLPPITVQDPSDKTALKRAKNTLAARESRQRKFELVQSLEKRIAELEADKEKWKTIAVNLGADPSS